MRRFYVSTQPDPALMDWRDPEASGQRQVAATMSPRDALTDWMDDNMDLLDDAAGTAPEGTVSLYVVEHDGDQLIGEVRRYRVPHRMIREFGLPVRDRARLPRDRWLVYIQRGAEPTLCRAWGAARTARAPTSTTVRPPGAGRRSTGWSQSGASGANSRSPRTDGLRLVRFFHRSDGWRVEENIPDAFGEWSAGVITAYVSPRRWVPDLQDPAIVGVLFRRLAEARVFPVVSPVVGGGVSVQAMGWHYQGATLAEALARACLVSEPRSLLTAVAGS